MSVSPSRNLFLMKSSLIDEAVAVDSAGMRQPAVGKAVAVENWISSDSIADTESPKLLDDLRYNWQRKDDINRLIFLVIFVKYRLRWWYYLPMQARSELRWGQSAVCGTSGRCWNDAVFCADVGSSRRLRRAANAANSRSPIARRHRPQLWEGVSLLLLLLLLLLSMATSISTMTAAPLCCWTVGRRC